MALDWKQFPTEVPVALTDIWVRIYWFQGTAFLAQYNSTNEVVIDKENGIEYPVWAVARWAYPSGGVPSENEPEVDVYIDGLLTELSAGQITRLNTLVAGLKSDLSINSLDEKFYGLYVLRGETEESSLRNLAQNAYYLTKLNSPSWAQWLGTKGNGSNQVLKTGFNANDFAGSGIIDDMAIGCESNESVTENGYVVLADDGTNLNRLAFDRLGSFIGEINGTSGAALISSAGATTGKLWVTRTGTTAQKLILDSTVLNSGGSSNGVANEEIAFLGKVDGTFCSICRLGFGFITKGLTEAEIDYIDARVQDYIDDLP